LPQDPKTCQSPHYQMENDHPVEFTTKRSFWVAEAQPRWAREREQKNGCSCDSRTSVEQELSEKWPFLLHGRQPRKVGRSGVLLRGQHRVASPTRRETWPSRRSFPTALREQSTPREPVLLPISRQHCGDCLQHNSAIAQDAPFFDVGEIQHQANFKGANFKGGV